MGILIKTPYNDLPKDEDGLQAFVQALPGFQGQPIDAFEPVDAIQNTDIFTAVSMIAGDLARMDIQTWTDELRSKNSNFEKLLNIRPNSVQGGYLFKFVVFANVLLTGHGYVEIIRDELDVPEQLFFRKTSTVERKTDKNNAIYYEVTLSDNKKKKVNFYDMIDFKFYSLDGFKGISLLETLAQTMHTDNYGKAFLTNFLKNGTHAGGILKMKGVLNNKEARDRAKTQFEESFSGSKKAGSVLVLDESMTYDQLEVDTSILKLIQDNKASTREVAGVFGIPLHKFGIETTNMSITDANLDYLSTLAPYMESITSTLDFYFNDPEDDGVKRFKFDTTALKVIDEETQANIDSIYIDKSIKTLDEIRAEKGLPPLPNGLGSKHRVDLNHVNIEVVDEYQLNNSDKKLSLSDEGGD
ncbi:phage portal protein [Macrococcoides goetzii]|nr:phage portal protein [Macrococcus goetzii]TDM47754.1 phage portal protein [Macrococcus goetzii]